ncbi:MAG: CBS domain-containing protein [Francisellaceae bacterium]
MAFKDYKLLETSDNVDLQHLEYFHPDTLDVIILETPALDVFADFHTKQPRIIHQLALANSALEHMKTEKVRALLVVDDNDQVIGLINSNDVQGMKRTQIAQKHDVNAKDVTVEMLMTPASKLTMIDYSLLKNAVVGHIARLLNEKNLDYILVFEVDPKGKKIIRGILSASFISRKLGMQIGRDLALNTLAEINRII